MRIVPLKVIALAAAAITVACAWYFSGEPEHRDGLMMVIALICFGRALAEPGEKEGSWKAAVTYILLVIALTGLSLVRTYAHTN